ncbi:MULTISPECIES: tetratricopeptide repeat protein [Xanthobacter]|uniref:Tetratricopeptide repeat protein n=1 Tax=Xanthobacter aminoxidans TaxID=186280 RepID=A0ABW6ZCR5_9HYPH|nr:tetratricopeptide repeat protein [Xanthobacter sp. 91]
MQKDFRADLARAGALHREGRLDQAIPIYRAILRDAPNSFEVARLLTLALLQSGRSKEAHAVARKARDGHKSNPHAQLIMGAVYQAEEKWDRALGAFEKSAELDPGLSEAHYLAANTLARLDRLEEAVARYDRVLEIDAKSVEARANRSVALQRLGRAEAALKDLDILISQRPGEARFWTDKASTLFALDRQSEAANAATQAIRLAPRAGEGYVIKGRSLMASGQLREARDCFLAALERDPKDMKAREVLVFVLRHLEEFPAALAQCDLALAQSPEAALFREHRAEVLRAEGDFAGALADVERAIAIDPRLAPAHVTRARLFADLGRTEEIRPALDAALEVDPQEPNGRFMTAADELARGRWERGWAAYESREHLLPPPYRPLDFIRWDGQERPELLVVVGEQGIGDELLFGRLVRLLADGGIRTVLLTRPGLVPLMRNLDARVTVVGNLSEIDTTQPGVRWIPAGSLPLLLQPDPTKWPSAPYLTAPADRIAKWRWVREEGTFTIGINWQGNPSRAVDVGRSIPLAAFEPLARLPGVRLVSLQHGEGTEQLRQVPFADSIFQLGNGFNADGIFLDTVGVLHHLDLVVSSDTALIHLCGARAFPAFAALRAVPDWRWGYSGERSVFFPSVRLFRQTQAGDWGGVFDALAAEIRAMV